MKEYALDDDLFYNLRRIDSDSGEPKLGFVLTVMCGAASGCLATGLTFPMDTIRRRMQIQNLHVQPKDRLSSRQQFVRLIRDEGLESLYRGWKPEMMKVIPMVGTSKLFLFFVAATSISFLYTCMMHFQKIDLELYLTLSTILFSSVFVTYEWAKEMLDVKHNR